MSFYDELETRSADARAAAWAEALPRQIAKALSTPGFRAHLGDVDPASITSVEHLRSLPVLRKSDLVEAQAKMPPLGGYVPGGAGAMDHVFQSPGPIHEPGMRSRDWWRLARFAHAAGLTSNDIVQNCFSYHFTPAGMMFESAAAAIGATVFPAGVGQTDLQVEAAEAIGTTAYAGTPDFLKIILEKAEEKGKRLAIEKALVSGGPLFPALREFYTARGISCLQCYATADLGLIAYESGAMEGMIVDEGVLVEIVTPGTGNPVRPGEIGEVVVTTLNPDYPLIRFATGDLSGELPGTSPCGRTNMRIVGWRGRADQATKVKGMFLRPEQVAQLVARHRTIDRVRVTVTEKDGRDHMLVQIETEGDGNYEASVHEIFKLKGEIERVAPGTLPNDGKVIDDKREFK